MESALTGLVQEAKNTGTLIGLPTVLDDLSPTDEAVARSNGTPFGFVAGMRTRDFSTAHRLAQRIDAG